MKYSALFIMAATTAVAQTNSAGQTLTMSAPTPAFTRSSAFFGGDPMGAVTGHPYSGLQETQTIQTLSDGTHVTQGGQKMMYYRDSLGRTRNERTVLPPPGFMSEGKQPVFVEINDPVAGYRYTLDPNGHSAYRTPYGPVPIANSGAGLGTVRAVLSAVPLSVPHPALPTNGTVSSRPAPQYPRPETSIESLGTQTMEGVLAEGTRTTTVWPAGIFGNDRPITTTNETWTWRELGITILTKTSDPRSGETTMKMTGISQAEPDPSLFQIPASYEINDPSGAVSK